MEIRPEREEDGENLTDPDARCWVSEKAEFLPSPGNIKKQNKQTKNCTVVGTLGLNGAVGNKREPR